MIIGVRVVRVMKQRVLLPDGFVLLSQHPLRKPLEETRIDLRHFGLKQILQQRQPLIPPLDSAPLRAGNSAHRRRVRLVYLVEQPGAPHRLLIEPQQLIVQIRGRPAHRIRAHVQAQIIFPKLPLAH